MNIIYLGTPHFAVAPLDMLIKAGHNIVAVVTQVDKVNARGKKVVFSDIKTYAINNNLPLYQFESIKKQGVEVLSKLNADIMITASYGQILSKEVLDICEYGVLNIHASLLPKLRGASPVASALLNGETKTGVTIMQTDVGLDDGKMLLKGKIEIDEKDNQQTLMDKLSVLGGELIVKVLDDIDNYVKNAESQNEEDATHCKKITKQDALIDFTCDAVSINNKIRAFYGNPTAFFVYKDEVYKVFEAEVVKCNTKQAGEVMHYDKVNGFAISCRVDALCIKVIQKQGGKVLNIKDFMNGNKFEIGQRIK